MGEPAGLVVVTGAAGRIGTVVAAGLDAAGLRLRLTDREPLPATLSHLEFRQADICDQGAVAAALDGASAVVHLAALPNSRDWQALERINVAGTRIVLEAAVAAGARRLIYASSIHVAGFASNDAPLHPDMPYQPDCPYGVSKVFGEALLRQLCDQHHVTGIALRICSFLAQPTQARHLRTFLSHADTVHLVLAALSAPVEGFFPVWGTSNNRRADVDQAHWRKLGYAPGDNAEQYVEALTRAGTRTDIVSEWPYLGGSFAMTSATMESSNGNR